MKRFVSLFAVVFVGGTPVAALAQISEAEFPARPDLTPGSPDDVLQPDFRGQIVYRGFYRGKVQVPDRNAAGVFFGNQPVLGGKSTVPMAGDYVITMEFDGASVSGSLSVVNGITAGKFASLNPARFMGTREGAVCHLSWSDGDETTVFCGRSEYRANTNKVNPNDATVRIAFAAKLRAAEFADYVERDRKRALEAEQARLETEQARQAAERERQRIAALPRAGAASAGLLEQAVSTDSRSWLGETVGIGNRYDAGSVSDVHVMSGTAANGTLRGEYSFNGGSRGWVEARMEGGKVACLHYWDTDYCGPVRTPPAAVAIGGQNGSGDHQTEQMRRNAEVEEYVVHQQIQQNTGN